MGIIIRLGGTMRVKTTSPKRFLPELKAGEAIAHNSTGSKLQQADGQSQEKRILERLRIFHITPDQLEIVQCRIEGIHLTVWS